MDSKQIFETKLSLLWSDYEPRKEQILMSSAIEDAFELGKNLAIEAGTGVGKSLAYLIPAALFSLENEALVVISTETKSLQDQILSKDIPIVNQVLSQKLNAMVALGANNYLCKRKYQKVMDRGDFGPEMESEINSFVQWEKSSETGIRSEYIGFISNSFWKQVAREPDNCLARNCPNFNRSFYFLEKERWKKANLLIVNHHLLASHMAGDFRILPPFQHLIIDEAHAFPEIVGKAFSGDVQYESLLSLLHFLYHPEKRTGLVLKLTEKDREKLSTEISEAINFLNEFFRKLMSEIPLNFQFSFRHTGRIQIDNGNLENKLLDIAEGCNSLLEQFHKTSEDMEEKEIALGLELASVQLRKASEFIERFRTKSDSNLVFWLEQANQSLKEKYYHLYSQPKNTEEILAKTLFPNVESVVMTSATLSPSPGNFSYFLKEIGTKEIITKTLDSPFRYAKQSLLFVPKTIADPTTNPERNKIDICFWVEKLIDLSEGNAFVLFTSNKLLQDAYEELSQRISYPIFSQVQLGPIMAKKEFLETERSVLFGVSSFWQGVDVKGDKLRNVIITKLPFQVPTEPVLQAKMEEMERDGKSPFWEIQVPKTCLLLRQGFGRLIRSSADSGMVAILDPRIHTKSYGKNIIQSLPKGIPLVTEFGELERKFQNLPK
ncbi:DNA helicase [Leptospira ryugenii]|uniref:DNA 5'-3' helicase n=1 Tax=Leptospira ryugenii TaxID=1917863 RepID=A0A2P2DWV6_9LEPT|nr:helicase C-terminal domain-containing protein [Leptospira ryugenii]GBF49107.1 DNA helicase [Leptospira ryugenii]